MRAWNPSIRVQREAFNLSEESRRLTEGRTDIGAVVSFAGYCRDEGGTLAALELEHYPGMAEEEIRRIARQASGRWPLAGLTIINRYGRIAPGEPIVLVLTASEHRQAAFEAASFLMDFLKTRAPFWKREQRTEGLEGSWVGPKDADDAAMKGWSDPMDSTRAK